MPWGGCSQSLQARHQPKKRLEENSDCFLAGQRSSFAIWSGYHPRACVLGTRQRCSAMGCVRRRSRLHAALRTRLRGPVRSGAQPAAARCPGGGASRADCTAAARAARW